MVRFINSSFPLRLVACLLVCTLSACGGGSHASLSIPSAAGLQNTSLATIPGVSSSSSTMSVAIGRDINSISSSLMATSLGNSSSSSSEQSSSVAASSLPSSAQASSPLNQSSSTSSLEVVSASSVSSSSSASPVLRNLKLSVEKSELLEGESTSVTVMNVYSDGRMEPTEDVVWSSTNGVIKIEGNRVTAVSEGQVDLTAETSGTGRDLVISNRAPVLVKKFAAMQGIYLKLKDYSTFKVGDQREVAVIAVDSRGQERTLSFMDVIFATSNPQVATVTNGVITAHSSGSVEISANYQGKTASYYFAVAPEGIDFHLLKPASWGSNINLNWRPVDDAGVTSSIGPSSSVVMADVDADGWYDISLKDAKAANVSFDDGGTASAGFHQTTQQWMKKGGWFVPDEFPNSNGYYYGTWYASKPILEQPVICDVKNYGAKGDGVTNDTGAIKKAIDDCAPKFGIVRLRAGKFLTGTLALRGGMILRIEPSATLLGSRNPSDYFELSELGNAGQCDGCRKALVVVNQGSVRIDGGGTIDASGGWSTDIDTPYPMAIFSAQAYSLTIQNVTIKSSASASLVSFLSSGLLVRGVNIQSSVGVKQDAIRVIDSRYSVLEDLELSTQGDAISIVGGGNTYGVRDIQVRNVNILNAEVGLRIGAGKKVGVNILHFDNIRIEHARGAAIAVQSVNGSSISDMTFHNITMQQVGTPFHLLLGQESDALTAEASPPGSINNITFANILAKDITETWGAYLSGVALADKTYPLTNLTFSNLDLSFSGGSSHIGPQPEYVGGPVDPGPSVDGVTRPDMPGYLFFRHIDNLILDNIKIRAAANDDRPLMVKDDVTYILRN